MSQKHLIKGTLIPFDRSNIDTDAILPKQYLKMLDKTGYAPFLFDDERYLDAGDSETPPETRRNNPEFILNISPYDQGNIIVARKNFGCGSSREHAVWAIRDFGIQAVIAESFGEIFFNNCIKNKVAPIILDEKNVSSLIQKAYSQPKTKIHIDLSKQVLLVEGNEITFAFPKKHLSMLVTGQDEIDETLAIASKIKAYEVERQKTEPWIFFN